MQNIEHLELLTARLRLKVLGPDFARQSLDYYTRNHAFLSEWNPTPAADFYTLAYHQERLRVELAQITILIAAFLVLRLLKKWTLQVQMIGSALVALAGVAWAIQRVLFPESPIF